MLHHIDDGKVGGPAAEREAMLGHLADYMLLKVSQPHRVGTVIYQLGKHSIRTKNGHIIVPDRKHADAICGYMGVTENPPNKEVMQLSVIRGRLSEAEQ